MKLLIVQEEGGSKELDEGFGCRLSGRSIRKSWEGMRMSFQDEMKQMFLHVAAGEVEPEEWGKWWNSNRDKLGKILKRGDQERIMP